METKEQIQAKYLTQHDALGTRKDASDKELFDQQHRKIWTDCDIELKARKTELETQGIDCLELDELKDMFPSPVPPTADEIRAEEILSQSPAVITQPEMWELVRIFGKKLGYKFEE